jgi:hypothetical protein
MSHEPVELLTRDRHFLSVGGRALSHDVCCVAAFAIAFARNVFDFCRFVVDGGNLIPFDQTVFPLLVPRWRFFDLQLHDAGSNGHTPDFAASVTKIDIQFVFERSAHVAECIFGFHKHAETREFVVHALCMLPTWQLYLRGVYIFEGENMQYSFDFKNFYLHEVDLQRHREGKIKMLVYGQNYIFFFHYDGDIYGGNEDSRLTYSTMKSDDEGADEMVFNANNLSAMMRGEEVEEYFRPDDIDEIEIITSKEAEHFLKGAE